MKTASVVATIAIELALTTPAAAQRAWVAASGPHVTVVSDADAGRARDVVWQFEQVRAVIARVWPWIRVDLAKPVVVLGARNENSFKALAPAYWEDGKSIRPVSVSVAGYDRAYVALRSDLKGDDQEGINPFSSAYWSYAAQALGGTGAGLPPWLLNGLASIVSNSLVRNDHIQVGRVLPEHLVQLRSRARLPLSEVVAMRGDDPRYSQRDTREVFDAEAWALVHFLMWAEEGKHQPLLNRYVEGLLSGANAQTSLASTIGDVARFENAFNVYVSRELFPFVRIDTEASVQREKFPVRTMPGEEAAALRAGFHAAMKRPVEAKALIAEARAANPGFGGADEAEALLADYADQDDELRPILERAAGRPGVSWYVPYRLAGVLAQTEDREVLTRVESLLESAVLLNPQADDALGFLGEVKAGLGRGEAALTAAERAVTLMPASSAHRLSLARVLMALDRVDDAIKLAGLGRALARTPRERDAAQTLLAELAKRKIEAAPAPGGATTTPVLPAATPSVLTPAAEPVDASGTNAARQSVRPSAGGPAGPVVVVMPSAQALAALEQACNAGAQASCVRFGIGLADSGAPASMARARQVLVKSCAAGTKEACAVLKQLPAP